jgi:CheY-like chemotaxis protein
VRRLRERDGWERLPEVALTGYSDEKWRSKAAACGFNRYAVKPFSLELITDWVVELGSAARLSSS